MSQPRKPINVTPKLFKVLDDLARVDDKNPFIQHTKQWTDLGFYGRALVWAANGQKYLTRLGNLGAASILEAYIEDLMIYIDREFDYQARVEGLHVTPDNRESMKEEHSPHYNDTRNFADSVIREFHNTKTKSQ